MKKVLIAEDEASIREFLVLNLERSGFEVVQAADGEQALRLFEENADTDVAILDIMMPKVSGLDVCKTLRAKSRNLGIILLTAKTQEADKVTGFSTGADDYVTKPFSLSELLARVDSVYRRVEMGKSSERPQHTNLVSGDFTLDMRSHLLKKGNAPIELTQVEFQIMEFFFQNEGAALMRTDILHSVWGAEYYGEEKIVDVNIRRLRMKIEDDPSTPKHLLTVWGVGYKWMA